MVESKIFYRRRLPHLQPNVATFFITFRLAGSLPREVVLQLKEEQEEAENRLVKTPNSKGKVKLLYEQAKRYFGKFDEFLDKATTGPRWLESPNVAAVVAKAIHNCDGKEYELYAHCIMSNHVHMVFSIESAPAHNKRTEVRSTYNQYLITKILRRLKGSSAREANKILNRAGDFWQHESYDHVIRDGNELERVIKYVLDNPVKAGLCSYWKEWKWTYLSERFREL